MPYLNLLRKKISKGIYRGYAESSGDKAPIGKAIITLTCSRSFPLSSLRHRFPSLFNCELTLSKIGCGHGKSTLLDTVVGQLHKHAAPTQDFGYFGPQATAPLRPSTTVGLPIHGIRSYYKQVYGCMLQYEYYRKAN
jgi:hypothetical protein